MILKECTYTVFLIDSRCFRRGVLLKLSHQDGRESFAEISPLPGFSVETLDDVLEQLTRIKRTLLTTWWTKASLSHLKSLSLYPSVHFGVESALLDLLDPMESPRCDSYALILGTAEEIQMRAKEAKNEGFSEAKLKLGHLSPEKARGIIDSLDGQLRLRIDLNRKWTLEQTLSLCNYYPNGFFTYIEEPSSHIEDLIHFPHPFALDETLRDARNLSAFLELDTMVALILKPTMLYPIDDYLRMGKQVVLTSSFEGAIGINQIKKLAVRKGLSHQSHGLDTLRYFTREGEHETLSDRLLAKALP